MLWALALSIHHESISRSAYYYERKYILSDVERAFDTKYSGTVHAARVKWLQEVTEFLEENLWHYDEAPDPDKLDTVQGQFGEYGAQKYKVITGHRVFWSVSILKRLLRLQWAFTD